MSDTTTTSTTTGDNNNDNIVVVERPVSDSYTVRIHLGSPPENDAKGESVTQPVEYVDTTLAIMKRSRQWNVLLSDDLTFQDLWIGMSFPLEDVKMCLEFYNILHAHGKYEEVEEPLKWAPYRDRETMEKYAHPKEALDLINFKDPENPNMPHFDRLFALAEFADYCKFYALLQAIGQTIGIYLEDKTPEMIFKDFGMEDQKYTPELEEQITKEHDWLK